MKFFPTKFKGITVIKTNFHNDKRGKFGEIFSKYIYFENDIGVDFLQDNFSISKKNCLRGLHYRKFKPQAQLLTILEGEIFDVVLDLRKESETFGKWYSIDLSADGTNQIFMDCGFAHGYYVKSSFAAIHYKVSEIYDPNDDFGIKWNDPTLKIKWPSGNPFLKERDANFPYFSQDKSMRFLEY
jgi:dTDP-4-dehydrorhamnose 3,5-epimerase